MPKLEKEENYEAGKLPADERNRTESQIFNVGLICTPVCYDLN